jgi:hypothetical protein
MIHLVVPQKVDAIVPMRILLLGTEPINVILLELPTTRTPFGQLLPSFLFLGSFGLLVAT